MKEIEFNEEELKDFQTIAKRMLTDEKDPSSVYYCRNLVRPKINWIKIILSAIILIVFDVFLFIFFHHTDLPLLESLMICSFSNIIIFLICAKKIIICIVHIYQRYAPDSIRNKCRFEPSCSEYMILSIKKYGLFKGVSKGIGRLRRCNIKNGGYDYP